MTDDRTDRTADAGERAFAARAREVLDANAVPEDVAARLRDARRAAIESIDERPRWQTAARVLAPAGGLAAGALVALVFLRGGPAILPDADERELAAMAEMELLDDMEFVAWLVENDERGGDDDAG